MNDPRRANEEELNQDQQGAPQGQSAQREGFAEGTNDFNEEDNDRGQRGGRQRQGGRYNEQAQGQDEGEETDELEEGEGEEAEQDEDEQPGGAAQWIDRVSDILTGKAEDVNYDKIARYASLAIVGIWGLRKGGLLGGLIASAALGLAAKSMGAMESEGQEEEQPEEEMEGAAA